MDVLVEKLAKIGRKMEILMDLFHKNLGIAVRLRDTATGDARHIDDFMSRVFLVAPGGLGVQQLFRFGPFSLYKCMEI